MQSLFCTSTQEGDDVYFECGIVSNPPVSKLEWYHEVRLIGAERRGEISGRGGERWRKERGGEMIDIRMAKKIVKTEEGKEEKKR